MIFSYFDTDGNYHDYPEIRLNPLKQVNDF